MSRLPATLALLLAMVAGAARAQSGDGTFAEPAASGTRFVLMFLQNIVDMPQNRPVELHVINQEQVVANVDISLPLYSSDSCQSLYQATVAPGSSKRIVLCSDIRHSHYDGGVSNKAVVVTSNVNVSVVGYNSDMYSADAFAVLPEASLRSLYMTTAYAPTNIATQFGIVAVRDTVVALYLPKVRPGGAEIFFDYNGVVYRNGDHVTFLLHRYTTFLAYSVSDLSGITVWASDAVAVFSGNARTYVDYSRGSRDHIVEQAIPSSQFGKSFAFYPIPRQNPGDVVRIVARSPATDVRVFRSGSSTTFTLINPGEVYEGSFTEVAHITATKPVSVSVIVRSQEGAAVASSDPNDPSIYFLPAVEHFSAVPRRTPTFVYSVNGGSFSKSYILISISDGLQGGLLIDGLPYNGPWVKPATSPLPVVSTVVAIDPSTSHLVSHVDVTAAYSVVLYAASDRESAATWLGLSYPEKCFDRQQVVLGDALDNDCDGLVDEENCTNSIDDDSDGLINEDCFKSAGNRTVQLGSKYELVFLSNDVFDALPQKVSELELYAFSSERKDMLISVTSPKYLDENGVPVVNFNDIPIAANDSQQFSIPTELRLGSEGDFGISTLTHKGIRVESKDDRLFFLYGINKRSFSTDSFLAYPLEAADNGLEYKCYYTVSSDRYANDYDRALIGIVAHEDNTEVWVDLREGVEVTFENFTSVLGPTTLYLPMMAHDSWELQSLQDLSGTKVYTKKYISVFSGNVRTRIPLIQKSRDHLVEQIPLTDHLGSNYSSISTPRDDNAGDLWKVIAAEDDVVVQYTYISLIDGTIGSDVALLAKAGDFFVIDTGFPITIYIAAEDQKKILVAQLVKSQTTPSVLTDPALIFVPSPGQWSDNYWFRPPLSGKLNSITGQQEAFENWALVVTTRAVQPSVIIADDNNHKLNGEADIWFDIPGDNDQVALRLRILALKMTASANGPFMLIMFGVQDRESYGSVAGLVFQRPERGCVTSPMDIADGKDNDCDGNVDEELFDGLDNDDDGKIDEDCYSTPNLAHRYDLVYEENTVEYPKLYALELVVGASSDDLVCRISNPTRASPHYDSVVIVPHGDVRRFEFSPSLRVGGSGVKWPNSFRVECSAPATVFALNKDTYSADGFVAFASESLGTRYYVMSYWPESLLAQYAAVATEPGQTRLTISPRTGPQFNVILVEGDVYQVQGDDLSGTVITADKKFALFSGDVRTSVKLSNSRDHLVAQIPSVDKWGIAFNLVPTAGRNVPDIYQIIAEGAATVTVCCASSTNVFNLDGSIVKEFTAEGFCHLTSSAPVLLARISPSRNPPSVSGDPSLIIVVPESLYGTGDTIATPVSTGGFTTLSADYSHYLTVIVPTAEQDGVRIDGVGSAISWTSVSCSSYSAGVVSVPGGHGVFRLHHANPSVRLTAVLDGNADRESYSITLSQGL